MFAAKQKIQRNTLNTVAARHFKKKFSYTYPQQDLYNIFFLYFVFCNFLGFLVFFSLTESLIKKIQGTVRR